MNLKRIVLASLAFLMSTVAFSEEIDLVKLCKTDCPKATTNEEAPSENRGGSRRRNETWGADDAVIFCKWCHASGHRICPDQAGYRGRAF